MVSRVQLLLLMSSLPLAWQWTGRSTGLWNCSSGLNLELTRAEEVMFCWLSSASWPPPPPPLYSGTGTCPELIAKLLPCSCSGRAVGCWGSMEPAHQTVSNKTRNPSAVVKDKGGGGLSQSNIPSQLTWLCKSMQRRTWSNHVEYLNNIYQKGAVVTCGRLLQWQSSGVAK